MNNTTLSYHGQVELIKLSKNKKPLKRVVVYNNGTNSLFTIFAKALAGSYRNDLVPTRVEVSDTEGGNNSIVSANISGLVYTSTSIEVTTPHTKLTAYIPYTSGLAGGEADKRYIILYSGNTQLASADITDSGIKDLSAGQSFLMNWRLYIDNGTGNNGGNE